jgi:mannan endo-1,6-alpha-mannosidase
MYEMACEPINTVGSCDTDQQSFKAYLSRWMAGTAKLCPWTHSTIMGYLKTSAVAAASQCEYVSSYVLALISTCIG